MNILSFRTTVPVLLLCTIFLSLASAKKKTKLIDNGYEGVVIAIHPDVPEDEGLIDAIKEMMVNASEVMYSSTRAQAYLKNITILVPQSWTRDNYKSEGSITFKEADIRIKPLRDDGPYAYAPVGCGEQGYYIHLTPQYVMNDSISSKYGPRGKVIVHEWAHYRWGVKDEYYSGTDYESPFYISSSGKTEYTRCPETITGKLRNGGYSCQYDDKTRLPIGHCTFLPMETQPNDMHGSLMYATYMSQVVKFCHDDHNDPSNMHNKEAKNLHNCLCDGRSAWDVIMDSVDFKRGERNTPGNKNRVTKPRFTVAKAQKKRIVLVLDSSGSMSSDQKMTRLTTTLKTLLKRQIPDGTLVGLVDFDTHAKILHPLLEMKQGDNSRATLITALQYLVASGNTSIGLGILKGIESAEGGYLFVLTDGQETDGPYVSNITKEVVRKGVIVHSIFFGVSKNHSLASLRRLSEKTGGKWYYSDVEITSQPTLSGIFAAAARPDDGDFSSGSVLISSSVEEKKANYETSSAVAIDGSVGNQTTFIFSWSKTEPPAIELTPPSESCIYSNLQKRSSLMYCEMVLKTDVRAKTVMFNIPGTAEMGFWKYNISSGSADNFTVTVTSAASTEGVYPIIVDTELPVTNVFGNEAAVIIATVFQNTIPVLGAKVTAIITRPKGDPVTLDLLDNGAGSDVIKNDGVYCRYFSQFNSRGRYSIQVTVFKDGKEPTGVANIPRVNPDPGIFLDDGTFVPNPGVNKQIKIRGAKIKGVLQRFATSSSLVYISTVPPNSDIFPPNKITDLSVKQVDLDNADAGLMLVFTAPGDDYDLGSATRYDIRYTNGSSKALLTNFTNQLAIATTSDITPKTSLRKEELVISVPAEFQTAKVVRIAFAIRSFDEEDNPSEVSNLASVTFFIEPPPHSSASPSFTAIITIIISTGLVSIVIIVIVVVSIKRCHRRRNNYGKPGQSVETAM